MTVQCVDAQPGYSTVTVSYDMSLLGDRDSSGFDVYAADALRRDDAQLV